MRVPFSLLLLVSGLACGARADFRGLDDVESELSARMGAASTALANLDGDALRAERAALVTLRLRAGNLRLPAAGGEVRAGILEALDAAADGFGTAAEAVDLQGRAAAPGFDPVEGKRLADDSARSMELCRRRLEEALAAIGRAHEARARLEAR